MKEESPFKKTVVITHVGPSAGCILSDEAAHHNVFQSFSKTYPVNNNKPVIDGMLGMFDELLNG